jgi:hypothetical protein
MSSTWRSGLTNADDFSECSAFAQGSPHSPQVPRTSITGRGAEKPASSAAARTPLVTLSSSMCTAWPHVSQIRKMQSWRHAGCWLAP